MVGRGGLESQVRDAALSGARPEPGQGQGRGQSCSRTAGGVGPAACCVAPPRTRTQEIPAYAGATAQEDCGLGMSPQSCCTGTPRCGRRRCAWAWPCWAVGGLCALVLRCLGATSVLVTFSPASCPPQRVSLQLRAHPKMSLHHPKTDPSRRGGEPAKLPVPPRPAQGSDSPPRSVH